MRRVVFLVVGLVLVAGTSVALTALQPAATGVGYRFGSIERGQVIRDVLASGRLEAVVSVEVSSQLSGQVVELFADFNDEVRAGQPLARLAAETYEARVREAEARLQNARAAYQTAVAGTSGARARVVEAERDLDRSSALFARGTLSTKDADRAGVKQLTTASDLAVAVAVELEKKTAIQIAEAALRQSEIDLQRTTIRSPIDGIVLRRSVDVGQTVAASLQAPTLFTITQDLQRMQVETFVDEADIGQVRVGRRAEFRVDAYASELFSGEIVEIRKAPIAVQNVVTYVAVITADNSKGKLLPGMTAEVRLIVAEHGDVLTIANSALRFSPPTALGEKAAAATDGEPGTRNGTLWLMDGAGGLRAVGVELGDSDDRVTAILGPDEVQAGQQVAVGVVPEDRSAGFFGIRWNR